MKGKVRGIADHGAEGGGDHVAADDEGDHETQQEVEADERRDGCEGACSKTHGDGVRARS